MLVRRFRPWRSKAGSHRRAAGGAWKYLAQCFAVTLQIRAACEPRNSRRFRSCSCSSAQTPPRKCGTWRRTREAIDRCEHFLFLDRDQGAGPQRSKRGTPMARLPSLCLPSAIRRGNAAHQRFDRYSGIREASVVVGGLLPKVFGRPIELADHVSPLWQA